MLITTKYLGPTNNRGSRIKASCAGASVTVSYPHELSGVDCHLEAVKKLAKKINFTGELIIEDTDTGYMFISTAGVMKVVI